MKFIRHSVDVYSSEARQLAYRLLEFMARGASAEPASLRGMFEGQTQGMRVNYYYRWQRVFYPRIPVSQTRTREQKTTPAPAPATRYG